MVNYCCVQGCGRNSRANKYLNYYSLPKKRARQKLWLIAAGKEDLLTKDLKKLQRTLRFCSRHFAPNSIKNRNLTEDAVPTKCLPGSLSEDEKDREPAKHEGIICDNCSGKIIGFRYKCVTCDNYDLCQKCEMLESHSDHYMLRIPRSLDFKVADNLTNKWKEFFKSELIVPDSEELGYNTSETYVSSDDEPVKKYVRNYDSGVDLSDDVKKSLQNEVDRALKAVKNQEKSKENLKRTNTEAPIVDIPSKKPRINDESIIIIQVNGMANEEIIKGETPLEPTPELVFADVNDEKLNQNQVKAEEVCSTGPHPDEQDNLRAFYLRMGIDLSQLMIHVVPSSGEAS